MIISIVLLSASVILLSIGIYKQKNRLDYLESYLEDTDLKIDIKHNLNKEEISSLLYRTDNSFEDVDKLITYTKRELEGKFANHMASGVEVKKALEEIKDLNNRLDKFIRNYQNI
jgi:hypothetical protein